MVSLPPQFFKDPHDDSRDLGRHEREWLVTHCPGLLDASDELEETEFTVAAPCAAPHFTTMDALPIQKVRHVRGRVRLVIRARATFLSVFVKDESRFYDDQDGYWLAWGAVMTKGGAPLDPAAVTIREGDMVRIVATFETGPTNHVAIFRDPEISWG